MWSCSLGMSVCLVPSPLSTISGCLAHCNLTAQASRLSNYILQRSFFFFARMSCSKQSTFHGQASDRVWSFPNCSFKASRRKKEKKRKTEKQEKKVHVVIAQRIPASILLRLVLSFFSSIHTFLCFLGSHSSAAREKKKK